MSPQDESGLRELMETRFTGLEKLLAQMFENLQRQLTDHIKHGEAQCVECDRRFAEHKLRLDRHGDRIDGLEIRVTRLERLDGLENRVTELEAAGGMQAKRALRWVGITLGGLAATALVTLLGYGLTQWIQTIVERSP